MMLRDENTLHAGLSGRINRLFASARSPEELKFQSNEHHDHEMAPWAVGIRQSGNERAKPSKLFYLECYFLNMHC